MFPYSDADVHHGTFPYVNVVFIGLCALVFLYQLSLGGVGFWVAVVVLRPGYFS